MDKNEEGHAVLYNDNQHKVIHMSGRKGESKIVLDEKYKGQVEIVSNILGGAILMHSIKAKCIMEMNSWLSRFYIEKAGDAWGYFGYNNMPNRIGTSVFSLEGRSSMQMLLENNEPHILFKDPKGEEKIELRPYKESKLFIGDDKNQSRLMVK